MNRLANPKARQYSFYTSDRRLGRGANGKARTVSGITTPNDTTIVFKLTKPVGDFNLRMSMPATAPIPEESVSASTASPATTEQRRVVRPVHAQGVGCDKLPCSALKPPALCRRRREHLILVRNPAYDQSTDQYRKNYPDTFSFVINSKRRHLAKCRRSARDEVSSRSRRPSVSTRPTRR